VRQHPARDQLIRSELMNELSHSPHGGIQRRTGLGSCDSNFQGLPKEDRAKVASIGIEILSCFRRAQDLWPLPFTCQSPPGYPAWDAMHAAIVWAGFIGLNCEDRPGDPVISIGATARRILSEPAIRFISKEIGDAFRRTNVSLPEEAPKIFLPRFVLALPKGLLVSDDGQDLRFLLVEVADDGRAVTGGAFVKHDSLKKLGAPFMACSAFAIPTVSGRKGDKGLCRELGLDPKVFEDESIPAGRHSCSEQIDNIVLNAILTMAHRPDLITEEAPLPPSGCGFARRNDGPGPRSVIWIGKDFKPRSRARTAADDQDGAPVATHWRRGHWHTVRHGSKREERRLQWYEPILVNAAA